MTADLGELTPWTRSKITALINFASKNGIDARVVSTRRSCAEQDAIYESGAGVATQAKGCISWHVWGRAADLELSGPASDYALLGDKWKEWGGVWGGDFSFGDIGHFEWHPGVKIEEVCPNEGACPDPNAPWPEDRPLFLRPAVQLAGGVVLALSGIYLAKRLSGGYALPVPW
jgi:hypothetical protein